MKKYTTAIVRYEKPFDSVKKAVELCRGLDGLPRGASVFIKPNIVFWTKAVPFPKYGVATTSRIVEDMVVILKELGAGQITIGEGMVLLKAKDRETPAHAFEYLGYGKLKQRYGVNYINIHERPFMEIDLGDEITLNYNTDILESDFLVNLPVLKTHSQTRVSLGIKNIKGVIDIPSRKKCHDAGPKNNLHAMVSRLADPLPPSFTLLDGIYTLERGPGYDGKARRSDLLVASADMLSADLVGASVLGHEPENVSYLAQAAKNGSRPHDLSDIEIVGEKLMDVQSWHLDEHIYNEEGDLPLPMVKMGISGLHYKKYDETMCTYCSGLQWIILMALARAWKGAPWDDVEVLTGKAMQPKPGRKKTVLVGKCMYEAHRDNPDINEMIVVKGCPPLNKKIPEALAKAGIEVDPEIFNKIEEAPAYFNRKYEGRPEFEESFFRIE